MCSVEYSRSRSDIQERNTMTDSWFLEDNINGLSDAFFDDAINSNLDVALEDIEDGNGGEDWNVEFQNLETPPMDMLLGSCKGNEGVQRILQHSQLSSSSSKSSINGRVSRFFQSSSPVSVLGSNTTFTLDKNPISFNHTLISPMKGARSKRKRPSTLNQLFLFPSPSPKNFQSSISCLDAGIGPDKKPIKRKLKKQKNLASIEEVSLRKCTHCETTETPQWRAGPKGPKTLCNACGVRFRSGRLVPEYRPVSSPTFSPSLHSNSHRKITEMRKKV